MASKDKLLASAQKNLQKGQTAKAIKDYQKLVDLDGDVRHRQKLAELYSRLNKTDQALEEYQQVAKHYADRGFYLKAIAVFKQMQKLDPENPDFYYKLADLNQKQGLVGNALAEYRNLVAFFEKKHQVSEVIKVLEAMRELDPENFNIRVKVAESYARHGLEEKALAEFRELVGVFRAKQDLERLEKLQLLFLPLFPEETEIPLGLAETLLARGKGAAALDQLKEILASRPDDGDVLDLLAEAYRQCEDFENERLTLKHLLKERSEDLVLRRRYLEACLDGNRPEKALEKFGEWREEFVAAGTLASLGGVGRRLVATFPDREELQEVEAGLTQEAVSGEEPPAQDETTVPAIEAESTPDMGIEAAEPDETREVLDTSGAGIAGETSGETDAAKAVEQEVAAPQEIGEAEVPLDFLEDAGLLSAEEDAGESLDETARESAAEEEVEESLPAAKDPSADVDSPLDAVDEAPMEESEPAVEETLELEIDLEIEGEGREEESTEEPVEETSADSGEPSPVLEADPGESRPGEPRTEWSGPEPSISDEPSIVGPEEADAGPTPEAFGSIASTEDEEEDLLELEQEALEILEEEPPEEEAVELELAEVVEGEEPVEELYDLELSDSAEENGAALQPADSELVSELEEAEFFLQQGLYAEAKRFCEDLASRFPESEEVGAKLEDAIEGLDRQAAEKEAGGGEFFDFGSEVLGEVEEQVGDFLEQAEVSDEEDLFSLDGVFSDSQRGVETDIDAEDTESHYNLGIAYKEMGLLDDAVAEFDQAMLSPTRRGDALTLKGICLAEQGRSEEAEEAFRTALAESGLPDDQQASLYYELGLLYQQAGSLQEALDCFQEVAARDHFFREVGERLAELRATLGLGSDQDKEPGTKDKRDRVSYV